jgi:hypothetical protein
MSLNLPAGIKKEAKAIAYALITQSILERDKERSFCIHTRAKLSAVISKLPKRNPRPSPIITNQG